MPRNGTNKRAAIFFLTRFNEAEASLPRNGLMTATLDLPDISSFNEAEASLPRNGCQGEHQSQEHLPRFNEAEASLPRNGVAHLLTTTTAIQLQ